MTHNPKSLRKRKDSQKKFFTNSLNLAIAATNSKEIIISPLQSSYKGKLIETYVHNRIKSIFPDSTFFKKRKNTEIDIWLQLGINNSIPIEIKSKTNLKPSDLKHLLKEINSKQNTWGIITSFADQITYNPQTKLVHIPIWLW